MVPNRQKQVELIEQVTRKEVMEQRDAINASPEQRASYIWPVVQRMNPKPTAWDIICFCAEAFASIAGGYDFLKPFAKRLIQIVYTAHYHTPDPYPSALEVQPEAPQLEVTRNDSFLG